MESSERQQLENTIKKQALEIERRDEIIESLKSTIGPLQDKVKELMTKLAEIKENQK